MAKGLDVGTMNIIAAKPGKSKGKATLAQQRNSFVEVEHSDMAEKMLARSKVLHIKRGDSVYIVGEDALTFANIFNKTTRRPMNKGILSRDEKSAIPMMRLIIEKLVGKPKEPGELIHFTCPARPVDAPHDVLYHQKTIESILTKLGYTPKALNEGMAVVYSELADNNFTGMGISFGAGMTNVCLSYFGVPVMTTAVGRGGDWIDEQVAHATGWTKDKVTAWKERDFKIDPDSPQDEASAALTVYYDALIEYVVRTLADEIRKARVEEGQSIPVVVTGGTAAATGFTKLLRKRLKQADLPFEVGECRRARSPLYSVAVGALVSAKAEEGEAVDEKLQLVHA